jgi:F0F1-type ATP synthase assembly protein I
MEAFGSDSIFAIALIIFMSAFGATAKYLGTVSKSKFSSFTFFSNLVVATFIGLGVALLCDEYSISRNLAGVGAGILGYAGHTIIDKIVSRVEKKAADKVDSLLLF